ncbi:MAG: acetyl-CoA carboxylase biotin carboxyl carrier protein subunit, partial [Verrucomicrobiota bacterium]
RSPFAGSVWKLLVEAGDEVSANDTVLVLESMKTEIDIKAGFAGTVREVHCDKGLPIAPNQILMSIETV